MARCKKDGSDWQQALQELRSTPTKDLPSPAEILHGRPARTVNGQAPAYPVNMDEVKQKLELKQEQYAQNYNRRHRVTPLAPLHLQQSVLIQHCSGNWEPATIQQIGPEPRSYLCTTNSGKVFRRNRRQICETGLPDQKDKLQPSTTTTAAKKSVRWSDDVYITVDAESAYSLATQGIQLFQSQTTANDPIAAVAPVAPVPAAVAVPVPPAEPEVPYAETDEDNQSHFSDSEREGNAEESLLTPDEQVTGVVSQTLETRPECSTSTTSTEQDAPAKAAPRRSRRKRTKVCYQPFKQRNQRAKKNK